LGIDEDYALFRRLDVSTFRSLRVTPEYRIISIGTLAAHPLWEEKVPVRTGHATTTLIAAGEARILVDPSLPAPALFARMSERTRLRPDEITHVFLTSMEPERRRALRDLSAARWLVHEAERESALAEARSTLSDARETDDDELASLAQQELDLIQRCEAAPDALAPNVDLFPLPGVTPGTCGLLIALPAATVLICGDAIATYEHLAQGQVLPGAASISQAQDSFREAVEIADILILGRDNLAINPLRRM
jgi:glyoxylase-like metal-dependent hydrolase (beta-lactamase superfamily II)